MYMEWVVMEIFPIFAGVGSLYLFSAWDLKYLKHINQIMTLVLLTHVYESLNSWSSC